MANPRICRDGVRLLSQCYKFSTSVDVGPSNRWHWRQLYVWRNPAYAHPATRHQSLTGRSLWRLYQFQKQSHTLLDALIVSSADGTADSVYRKEMPVAHECLLSWCVKTLQSSYSWGIYEESVESTVFNTTKTPYPWATIDYPERHVTDTNYTGNVSIYAPDQTQLGPEFGLSNNTVIDFTMLFDEIFPTYITVANATAKPFLKIKTSYRDRVLFRAVRFSPWLAPNNITHHMGRIATALTNVIRSDTASREFIVGQALAPETYLQVKWAWLAFPLAMLIFCVIFLIATIVKTSSDADGNVGAWKTSAMPTLMYGLPQDMRQNLTTGSTWRSESSGGAKKVKIRLMPDQGWRVSGYMCTSPTTLRRTPRAPPGWL
jgi:hypothetical protein